MESLTFYDIEMANKFAMQYYTLSAMEKEEPNFLIIGDNGFSHYFRIEIRFIDTSYIRCPTFFTNLFSFRRATEDEAQPIREVLTNEAVNVFCLERRHENYTGYGGTCLEVKPFKCLIAAGSVEITVYYGGDMQELLKISGIE